MLKKYNRYEINCMKNLLTLSEILPPDLRKYILYLYNILLENEIKPIILFPKLINFYLKYDKIDRLNLAIKKKEFVSIIETFCHNNSLLCYVDYSKDCGKRCPYESSSSSDDYYKDRYRKCVAKKEKKIIINISRFGYRKIVKSELTVPKINHSIIETEKSNNYYPLVILCVILYLLI